MAGNLTAMIASIFSGGVTPDPYYPYTTLLLPGNGTNGAQNNTFLDGSTNNFTITRNGNTTQGTFSPFSQTGWGGYFSGAANYLSVAATTSIDLASSDFTIECWAYPGTQTNAVDSVFGYGGFTTMLYRNGTTWSWEVGNGSSANYFTITATVTPNAWQHIALTRSGNMFTFWINGSSAGTNSTANAVGTASKSLTIGYNNTSPAAQYFTGYISNFRLTKGRAVYTGAFTPPTIPLTRTTGGTNPPQGTECSLLTCQSNRFLDSNGVNTPASSPLTITPNGSPSVQAFSPFNPTASWSAATYGGSGYFDGSGDYLSATNNAVFDFNADPFTIEMWFYITGNASLNNDTVRPATLLSAFPTSGSTANTYNLYIDGNNTTTGTGIGFSKTASGTNVNVSYTATIPQNTWHHVAVVRSSSTTLTLYLNGQQVAQSTSYSGNVNTGGWPIYVAQLGYTGYINAFPGYISNLRIVKGTAVYTAAFTPPTAPLTATQSANTNGNPSAAITGTATSLLLNFTNAGIYDATSKNDLETVGNAQISTAQSKWGGSSMAFDGTGDWLLIPDQPIQRIGTGNFTVEGWVYRNSSGTYGLVGKGTGTTGWLLSLNSSNQVVFTYGSSTITSTGTVSATTWTHIAVVREGTSTNQTKIYINGTNDGTGTVSTDFNQTNSMYVGADRTGGSAANVYMQDVRVTNYARYTSNFTAPTAAFPTL